MSSSANDSLVSDIWTALKKVNDPEIPAINIVEMGMIHHVLLSGNNVIIQFIPTYLGCPALNMIKNRINEALSELDPALKTEVVAVHNPIWSSNRITPEGREKLRQSGIASPPSSYQAGENWNVDCPYCGSSFTTMDNLFGPAACRSILYCKDCKNPFEAIKPM